MATMGEAEQRGKKRAKVWLGAGCLGLFAVVLLSGVVLLTWARRVPPLPPRAREVPPVNAFDDYVAAVGLVKQAGGTPKNFDIRRMSPAQLRPVARQHRGALARARQGFAKPYLAPMSYSMAEPFPYLSGYRELARLFAAEAKVAASEGRYGDAADSCLDAMWLGSDVGRQSPLIHGLVGIAVSAIGSRQLGEIVPRLSEAEARAALKRLREIQRRWPPLTETLDEERHFGQVALRETFQSSDPAALTGGPASLRDKVLYYTYPRRWAAANYESYMQRLIAEARKPLYQRQPVPEPDDPIVEVIAPVIEPAGKQWTRLEAERQVLETALLLQIYRHRQGAYPPSLQALQPEAGPANFTDPFTGKPLLYRGGGSAYTLYSIGPDGVDNGGVPIGRDQAGDIVVTGGVQR